MAKNPRRQQQAAAKVGETKTKSLPLLSRCGKKMLAIGIGVVVIGFWVLTYTDPAGQNWASTLSPALLVLGYVIIGIAIVVPDPISDQTSPTLPPTDR